MSVITSELSNSLESLLLKNNSESKTIKENMDQKQSGSFSSHGSYFILDHEPSGTVSSSPRYSSNTNAVSIPYSSKYRRNGRIRLGSTNSPSSSLSPSSATANGSLSHPSLKESLNKTISSLIENCQEKVIIHNNSPSSSYSFTKHSTVIYSPSKVNSIPTNFAKSKLSQSNIFPIKKIKPTSLKKESKLSEITFGLQKKEQPFNLKSNSDNDTKEKVESKKEELIKAVEKKEESIMKVKNDEEKIDKKEEILKETNKVETKPESTKIESSSVVGKAADTENLKVKTLNKTKSLAKIESKREKEMLQKVKGKTHKKTLSLPSMLTPLTPLSGMDENSPPPETRKRRKSVNFSSDSFKSICIFTTTDKPESIKDSKVEVKTDNPENDLKDKEFSELRGYENAWSPVPRNVIHIQKFKSSKAKHVQYELPVSIQSFKLVKGDPEETEDKLTCLKVTLNVQNLNYEKKVVIRYTTNKWKSFKEIDAKYVKCIREPTKEDDDIKGVVGLDRFVARIPVGQHFVLEEKPGHIYNQRPTKMLLVARYEVNNNTYWDNNDFTDYHIELVRINAGYDVPRVSKHGKPIPCPGCSMDSKQSHIIEKKGNEIKNNRRTVRKIGGVFGNFTDAVAKNNDPTNFMADKNKSSLYMGMDGSQSSTKAKNTKSEANITDVLTEEPQSMDDKPATETKSVPKKKKTSLEKVTRPVSYTFGSPSLGGSPMFSTLGSYQMSSSKTGSTSNTTTPSTTSTSIYSGMSTSSKYNPPMSTTSSLYPGTSMTSASSYNPSSYSFDMSASSKYEPSPYNGGVSYDPSAYGGYPTTTTSSYSNPSTTSKYDVPNEYSQSSFSKYDPPSYYNSRSYSTPLPNTSTPSTSDNFGSSSINTKYSQFSDYNFGTNLVKKATQDYSAHSDTYTHSKYDVPFSTYSSFGDNFSNYYNMSPSAVTY